MTFVLLAAVAGFAAFALVNTAASAFVALTAGRVAEFLERYSPASRSALLFRLRLAPAALAAIAGFGIALPVFVTFEPIDTDEPLSWTLAAVALAGVSLLVHAAWRAFAAWRATARRSREWQGRGRRLDAEQLGVDVPYPMLAVDTPFPMVAVAGVLRPVLFVAERVLAECSIGEVRAMIAHECAHVGARDNLKRFILRACPDLIGAGSRVSRTWASAAEEAADAAAIGSRPDAALDLAQALIRVARLAVPEGPALASSFYAGGSVESRVHRLVEPAPSIDAPALGWVCMSAALAVAFAAIALAPALHQAMEIAVRVLP